MRSTRSAGVDPVTGPQAPTPVTRGESAVSVRRSAVWTRLLAAVARDRTNQLVFLLTVLAVGVLYSVLLPFEATQRVSWANWGYLDARLIVWIVLLSVGMASVVVIEVHALRQVAGRRGRQGALGGAGLVASLLPSMLCCTPVIPMALAFLGLSTVGVYSTTGALQHLFATHQTQFFVGSLTLMLVSAGWGLRDLATATCHAGPSAPAPAHCSSDAARGTGPGTPGSLR